MNSVYTCAAGICVCLVVCSVVKIIAPSGSTSRIMTAIIGIFALCCMITPAVDLVKSIKPYENISYNSEFSDSLSTKYDNQVLVQTSDYINEYIKQLLKNENVTPNNIKTVIAESETDGIYVRSISIYIDKEINYKSDVIKKTVSSSIGTEPMIITE